MAQAMAHDLSQLPNARVHSVVSQTQKSARIFSESFGRCRIYESVEEMTADPQIDVVYISSPNHLHYPQAKLALQAGKPVLCEKPFTLNAIQLEELIAMARSRRLFLMEAMWIRWLPTIVKFRELMQAAAIGEPRLLKAGFHAQLSTDPDGRIYNLAMGGGSLLDLGIYPISLASLVFGKMPDEIASSAQLGDTGIDEHFGAVFRYGKTSMALVSAGVTGLFRDPISVHGTAGSIRLENAWRFNQLVIEPRDGEPETFTLPMQGKGYGHQAVEVMRCLDAGLLESPVMPLAESLAIMQTLDRLRAQWGLRFPDE